MELDENFTVNNFESKEQERVQYCSCVIGEHLPFPHQQCEQVLLEWLDGWEEVFKVSHLEGLRVPETLSYEKEKFNIYGLWLNSNLEKGPSRDRLWNIVSTTIDDELKKYILE